MKRKPKVERFDKVKVRLHTFEIRVDDLRWLLFQTGCLTGAHSRDVSAACKRINGALWKCLPQAFRPYNMLAEDLLASVQPLRTKGD